MAGQDDLEELLSLLKGLMLKLLMSTPILQVTIQRGKYAFCLAQSFCQLSACTIAWAVQPIVKCRVLASFHYPSAPCLSFSYRCCESSN